jgi:hypothetical protein
MESNETKTGDPRVATIVLNQSQLNLTRDALQSIVSSSWKANCIILVDNHSTDGSAGQLAKEFPMIEIIQSPVNIGCAGGWNLAARVADGSPRRSRLDPGNGLDGSVRSLRKRRSLGRAVLYLL